MIITAAEFAEFRPEISKGWSKDKEKIERCINDAENVDLFDVLGSFYFDVLDNLEAAEWSDLLNGSTFTFEDEKSRHIGLKSYLAALAYSRLLPELGVNHTPFGLVNKLSQDSEPVNFNALRDKRKDLDKTNEILFKRIDKYILSKPELFRNYKSENNPNINTNKIKTSTLR